MIKLLYYFYSDGEEGNDSPRIQDTYRQKLEPTRTKIIRDNKQRDIYEYLKKQSEERGGAVF